MEPQDSWVFYKDIDWSCPKNNRFNVDTRDFHVGYHWKDEQHPDFSTLKNYPHFFHTEDELKSLLDRYFTESGGEGEWRYFSLMDYDKGWNLKYIRIFRTDLGFVVCDCDNHAIKKDILSSDINKKLLHM